MKSLMQSYFWLVLLIFATPFILTGCESTGADDDEKSAEEIIIGIINEMTEGWAARTEEAYENKVFPHISEFYEHAGFGKQDRMDESLEDLEENPDLSIDEYELDVEVQFTNDKSLAIASVTNQVKATMPPDDNVDFTIRYEGITSGISHFAFEEGNGWKQVGGEAQYNELTAWGGKETYRTDMSDIAASATELGPGDSVDITGSVELPEVEDGELIFLQVTLNWEDDRNNAELWWSETESVLQIDITEDAGNTYEIDLTFPDDGTPAGLEVPGTLPLGADVIDVFVSVVVATEGDEPEYIRLDAKQIDIPFAPLENEDPCETEPGDSADGIWALTTVDDTLDIFNYFELADLRIAGEEVYGSILYASKDEFGQDAIALLEVTGSIDGDQITFGLSGDGVKVTYEATVAGAEMTGGTLTFESTETYVFEFTGDKLDNRCVGLLPGDMDGATITSSFDGSDIDYNLVADDAEIILTGDNNLYEGFLLRNIALGIDSSVLGGWMLLGFFDDESGYIAVSDNDMITEGTFTVEFGEETL